MHNLLPMYYQIKETIKSRISNKEFLPGERIPSVAKLAEHFKVNHLTVRQAIGQLEREGFLLSKRGSGTFVSSNEAAIKSLRIDISGSMNEILSQVQKSQTKSVEMMVIDAPVIIREKLELGQEEKTILRVVRVRFLDNLPLCYAINYFPMGIGSKIAKMDLYKKPLLQILDQDLKIHFSEAVQTMQSTFADQEIAEKLEMICGSPMLFVERILYGIDKKPIEMLHSHYCGDLYKYTVRLKNVRDGKKNVWVQHDNI
jgi:GntR family transcriptional regulator